IRLRSWKRCGHCSRCGAVRPRRMPKGQADPARRVTCAVPMSSSSQAEDARRRQGDYPMTKPSLSRLFAVALSAGTMLAVPAMAVQAQEGPGAGTTVRMAQATWDTGWFHAEIYKQLLEKLGYTVEGPTTLDNPPFYQAVAQGDLD